MISKDQLVKGLEKQKEKQNLTYDISIVFWKC